MTTTTDGAHTHTVTNRAFTGGVGGGGGSDFLVDATTNQSHSAQATPPTSSSNGNHNHNVSGYTNSINGGVTQTTMNFSVNYVDLIIATKD